jgi:hypothetical protein
MEPIQIGRPAPVIDRRPVRDRRLEAIAESGAAWTKMIPT